MLTLADIIDRRFRKIDYSNYDFSKVGLLRWNMGRLNWNRLLFGLVLGDEVLWLNTRHPWSFRTKTANTNALPGRLTALVDREGIARPPLDLDSVSYFRENQDNPFAAWNCVQQFYRPMPHPILTQFPPLTRHKTAGPYATDIETMHERSLPGDNVFTFDRTSGLAQVTRRYDWGMWSHVGTVDEDKNLSEMGTSGLTTSAFSRLSDPALDVGLYRLRGITDADRASIMERLNEAKESHLFTKYNWWGVIRIFLNKGLNLPIRRPDAPSPNEMIYSNNFDLISYA